MKNEQNTEMEEEIFDDELKAIFGDRYQDETIKKKSEPNKAGAWDRIKVPAMLAAAAGMMFFMCWFGKIELPYGLAFLACFSAAFGHSLRKAGVYEV